MRSIGNIMVSEKLDNKLDIVDTVRVYVQSAICGHINPSVKKMTGINEQNLGFGLPLPAEFGYMAHSLM